MGQIKRYKRGGSARLSAGHLNQMVDQLSTLTHIVGGQYILTKRLPQGVVVDVDVAALLKALPKRYPIGPTSDGTWFLKCVRTSGVNDFSWVEGEAFACP